MNIYVSNELAIILFTAELPPASLT